MYLANFPVKKCNRIKDNKLFSFNNLQVRIIFLDVTGSSRWATKDESFATAFLLFKQFFFSVMFGREILPFSDEPENRHYTKALFGEVRTSPDC